MRADEVLARVCVLVVVVGRAVEAADLVRRKGLGEASMAMGGRGGRTMVVRHVGTSRTTGVPCGGFERTAREDRAALAARRLARLRALGGLRLRASKVSALARYKV